MTTYEIYNPLSGLEFIMDMNGCGEDLEGSTNEINWTYTYNISSGIIELHV